MNETLAMKLAFYLLYNILKSSSIARGIIPVVSENYLMRFFSGTPIVYDFPDDVWPYAIIEQE